VQITIRIPDDIVKEADEYIDHVHIRSRAHLITVALAEWLDRQKEEEEYEDEFDEDEKEDEK